MLYKCFSYVFIIVSILIISFLFFSNASGKESSYYYIFHFYVRYSDMAINDGNVQVCALNASDAQKKAHKAVKMYAKKYKKKVSNIKLQFINNTGECDCPNCAGFVF